MKKAIAIALLLLATLPSYATHLVGGEMSYIYKGNNTYEVTLVMYRDCFSGGPSFFDVDASVVFSVFDINDSLVKNIRVNVSEINRLPLTAPNNCSNLSNGVCTEEGVFIADLVLPPKVGGYTISFQRCCRNSTISNIPNPGALGNTYTISIPSNDIAGNSSPAFKNKPPLFLCHMADFYLDMSVIENDGDSIYYELCDIFNGGGQAGVAGSIDSPQPNPAAPPPYTPVPFSTGFSSSNPIPSSPNIAINPNTGEMSGRPTSMGQYSFGICVTEYRNGIPLSTLRRDFQFNVTSLCTGPISQFPSQNNVPSTICAGTTITFQNNSLRTQSYLWDFGIEGIQNDTSHAQNPTYTFPDTGMYTITLIANPTSACSDTSIQTYHIFKPFIIFLYL